MPSERPDCESFLSKLIEAGCGDEITSRRQLPSPGFIDDPKSGVTSEAIFWVPRPLPPGRATHLASSRLGKSLECFPGWFDAVRTVASSMSLANDFFVTAEGTTADRFVQRVAQLFEVPVVRLRRVPKTISKAWVNRQRSVKQAGIFEIWFAAPPTVKIDSLLVTIASDVRVLRVTAGGNVERCVKRRLASAAGRTWVLVDDHLSKPAATEPLIDAGAMAWWLFREPTGDPTEDAPGRGVARSPTVDLTAIDPAAFLLHWTRRRPGPWPNQTDPAYLDDLLFRRPSSDHGVLAVLRHILVTERIIAANDLTRSTTPVVCFSDVRLDQIDRHRKFRKHLGRWDFEPYGIAIKRDCLQELSARPVIYGQDKDWAKLSAPDQPFFQVATSSDGQHDWRAEREWRICGDVRLRQIASQDAVVFVPSQADAEHIAPLSRWPVVVLEK